MAFKFYKFLLFSVFMNLFISCKDCTPIEVKYVEKEPYIGYEEEPNTLTYKIKGQMYYKRISGTLLFGNHPKLEAYCEVTNTSDYGGNFHFYANLTSSDNEVLLTSDKYIEAGRTVTMRAIEEIPHKSFQDVNVSEWGVDAPTIQIKKEVTLYRDVVKEKKCNPCEEDCKKYDYSIK